MLFEPIEYVGHTSPTKYYITVGNNAPWDNIHIKIPKFLFKAILQRRKNDK